MAPATSSSFSVILPTYNERENLPLMVCLIARGFEDAYAHTHTHTYIYI